MPIQTNRWQQLGSYSLFSTAPPAIATQKSACAELGLVPPTAEAKSAGTVDATNRFAAKGACWVPSRAQLRRTGAAALGLVKCKRL